MGVRNLHNFSYCPRLFYFQWVENIFQENADPGARSPEIFHRQSASLHDALERAEGNRFAAVHGHNDLAAVGVTPLLMAALLAHQQKTVPAQDPDDIPGIADGEMHAHGSATSKILAPVGMGCGDGSNQSSRASFALATASSSVSPAEAQPGSSGKNAAQRRVAASCSTTNRSFMPDSLPSCKLSGNLRS